MGVSAAATANPGTVPGGTAAHVLAWAGVHPGRVQEAYDAELTREPKPRTSLLAELERRGAR